MAPPYLDVRRDAVYWMLTLSNVAVVLAVVMWLVTASPTNTDPCIEMVVVPTSTHVEPSLDSYALKVSPLRTSCNHRGGPEVLPAVLTLVPLVASRRWKATPLPADTRIVACFDPASRVSRIIRPPFDHALANVMLGTRA